MDSATDRGLSPIEKAVNKIASATWNSLRHLVYYSKSSASTTYSKTVRGSRCEHNSDRRVFPNPQSERTSLKAALPNAVNEHLTRVFGSAARETIIKRDHGENSCVR